MLMVGIWRGWLLTTHYPDVSFMLREILDGKVRVEVVERRERGIGVCETRVCEASESIVVAVRPLLALAVEAPSFGAIFKRFVPMKPRLCAVDRRTRP